MVMMVMARHSMAEKTRNLCLELVIQMSASQYLPPAWSHQMALQTHANF